MPSHFPLRAMAALLAGLPILHILPAALPQASAAGFSYRVFAEPDGLPLPSPQGRSLFPHPTGRLEWLRPPYAAPVLVSFANLPFSKNDPWLPEGATQTKGNNVDAYADLAEPDGFAPSPAECALDAERGPDFHACATAQATFDHMYDSGKESAAGKTQGMAAVTNLFYINNWLHDWFYDAGFDEAAGNAQDDNFGRGGIGGDPLLAEAQDRSGRDNANMQTPADGGKPRMQMYLTTGPNHAELFITSPAAAAGPYRTANALFGAQTFSLAGRIVAAKPALGCGTGLDNAAELAGHIAYFDRGECTFIEKVRNAQAAGALAVLVGNNRDGTALVTMTGEAPDLTIGAFSVSEEDARRLKANLDGLAGSMLREGNPGRDGALDAGIVAHEWGHYISNRLIGNANGLSNRQGRALGEGWGDFHALLMLVKESDLSLTDFPRLSGAYPIAAYIQNREAAGQYAGVRRYPYSRDLGRNPLSFRHAANGSAIPSNPPPSFATGPEANTEVHNAGEIWASMLWQCYSNLLLRQPRLEFAEAQRRMKGYLVAGYKMTPVTPTMLEARDALLAVILAQDRQDYEACQAGFARRGGGSGAVAPPRGSEDFAGLRESFAIDVPGAVLPGPRAAYRLARAANGDLTLQDRNGAPRDTGGALRLRFDDMALALDTGGAPGRLLALYSAAFNRAPDMAGLGFYLAQVEQYGMEWEEVAQRFLDSPEFADRHGRLGDQAFALRLWSNALSGGITPAGRALMDGLEQGTLSRADVLLAVAGLAAGRALESAGARDGIAYLPWQP